MPGGYSVPSYSTVSWTSLLEQVQATVSRESYDTWFRRLSFLDWNGACLRLSAPNRYVKEWIESHYQNELLSAARSIAPETVSTEICLVPTPLTGGLGLSASAEHVDPVEHAVPAPMPSSPGRPAGDSALGRDSREGAENHRPALAYRIDSFVVGSCNRLAHAACQTVVESPALAYNPLVIHGDHGLGKTHLLQSVAHALQARSPGQRVRVLSCEEFGNGFVYALQTRKIDAFRGEFRKCHALLVDDLQFLGGKEKTQDEFLHTIDHLRHMGRQLVFSCHVHPREIKHLNPRITERLQSGLVTRLAPPTFETRVELLRIKARQRALLLPAALAEILALRVERSVRELEGVICKLAALCATERQAPDKELALLALRELGYLREGPLALEEILEAVVQRYNQDADEIRSARRHAGLVRARHLSMYLAKQLTSFSLGEIGRFFGNRDHSTVLQAVRKVTGQIKLDEALRAEVQALRRILGR